MTQVSSRYSTMILISMMVFWLLLLAGNGWWLWTKYQTVLTVDATQVKAAGVKLNVEQLDKAVSLLGG